MVTRKDIAERAQVSVSVVSRALNNSGYVDAEKREQILKIADELGYHPSPVAMSLMTQRTKQILFYCKDMRNAFNIEVYRGMLAAAEQQGYMVVVNGNLDFRRVKGIMADGLILPNDTVAEVYLNTSGKNYHLPVVAATYGDLVSFSRSMPTIKCDMWEGMDKVLNYLWERGHRRIALVTPYIMEGTSARNLSWINFMKERMGENNWKDYFFGINSKSLGRDLSAYGFSEEMQWGNPLVEENFFEKGELAAEIFKERNSKATAVACFNDEMALGFCKRMRKLGYEIPKDVSVVGIDGAYARKYADQKLTSLAVNPEKQGRKCVEVLLNLIHGKKIHYVTKIPMKILEGETVRDLYERR